ncbi:long-chain acyl-CoA synthetase, putative [Theileria equi strain WA]|uniref:Long-chain acyl-CoA synthetase, putative n=1 Tax=Theileria equi strain WA TaxID=1537102 RepID=L0AVE7_THEEQ|nr:long-chain acyl-CoA synthetase, putative [Theileria equi strain WA]AFZ78986.1 long-chain acyl-CoA synthetase, putative [Theileria equi strain WA]|eukprot:XP_004828652.1 long-chain acyl-CoA synthetase, putative [Theileria equi strain WA]
MEDSKYFLRKHISRLGERRNISLRNIKYSKLVEKNNKKGESDIYGCLEVEGFSSELAEYPEHINTRLVNFHLNKSLSCSFDLLCEVSKFFGDKDHLGSRSRTLLPDGSEKLGSYVFTSYNHSVNTVKVIGTALTFECLPEKSTFDCPILKEAYILGIWAVNCPYWLLTDYASIAYGIITVPMYETLGDEALLNIMSTTQMKIMCIDSKKLPILKRLSSKIKYLETIIIFDTVADGDMEIIKELGLKYLLMDDLVEKYKDRVKEPLKSKRTDICTIIYTSGTSGAPKGSVYTNEGILSLGTRLSNVENRIRMQQYATVLSYLPLTHVYQRFVEHFCCTYAVRIGYYSGNIRAILDDLNELRPTIFIGVPRVFTKILHKIRTGIEAKPRLVRYIMKRALERKRETFKTSPEDPTHWLYDIFMKKVKSQFGGAIESFVLGSAAMTESDITDFQAFLTAPVSEGWGTTEVGVAFLQDYRDTTKGTIGGPLHGVQFKLRSIEALEYDARGTPPRGELLVKSPGIMLGYLANPSLTSEVLDSDGWYHTGDVVELLDNMGVKILDRARNIFKISQGEYIAPDKLENAYVNAKLVEQVYVHGESTECHIVGIVVVASEEVQKWASQKGLNKPVSDLLHDTELINAVRKQFDEIANAQNFNSLERLKIFKLVDQLFSTENGLLTPTFKSVRFKIKAYYESEIKEMYNSTREQLQES